MHMITLISPISNIGDLRYCDIDIDIDVFIRDMRRTVRTDLAMIVRDLQPDGTGWTSPQKKRERGTSLEVSPVGFRPSLDHREEILVPVFSRFKLR